MPDSLIGRIMEAKYYEGRSFLESVFGKRPLFAWRCIYGSRELLREGLIWRIGNGAHVRIWKDRWVPRPSTNMIQSSPRILDPNAKVEELIDHDTHWWKPMLLERIFLKEDVDLILSIPMSMSKQEDVCIWRGEGVSKWIVLCSECLLPP
jgi:hypothetical protein